MILRFIFWRRNRLWTAHSAIAWRSRSFWLIETIPLLYFGFTLRRTPFDRWWRNFLSIGKDRDSHLSVVRVLRRTKPLNLTLFASSYWKLIRFWTSCKTWTMIPLSSLSENSISLDTYLFIRFSSTSSHFHWSLHFSCSTISTYTPTVPTNTSTVLAYTSAMVTILSLYLVISSNFEVIDNCFFAEDWFAWLSSFSSSRPNIFIISQNRKWSVRLNWIHFIHFLHLPWCLAISKQLLYLIVVLWYLSL